jgi:hypothetical protein
VAWPTDDGAAKQALKRKAHEPLQRSSTSRLDSHRELLALNRHRDYGMGIRNALRLCPGGEIREEAMNTARLLSTGFMQLHPKVRRFIIGLVFYLLWYVDMRYFAHSALGPWISGVTLMVFFWAWGFWTLVYIFMLGLLSFVRFYLIFLR